MIWGSSSGIKVNNWPLKWRGSCSPWHYPKWTIKVHLSFFSWKKKPLKVTLRIQFGKHITRWFSEWMISIAVKAMKWSNRFSSKKPSIWLIFLTIRTTGISVIDFNKCPYDAFRGFCDPSKIYRVAYKKRDSEYCLLVLSSLEKEWEFVGSQGWTLE